MKWIFFTFVFFTWLVSGESEDWLTRAERTSFQETSRYEETIQYCKKLESSSPWIRLTPFGKSPEGRDLPLLIVSSDKLFTPEQARKSNHAVVLVINGIHAGEIAGKDATLMLVRDLVIKKEKAGLLDRTILLVVPIFSVDGHERFGPYNRINQKGPKEMGWRTTSQNLNLNRDWMKADQPEMRDMLRLFSTWLPDLIIDNHMTDGADFQYDILYIVEDYGVLADPVRKYWHDSLRPAFDQHLASTGHITGPYFEVVDELNPAAGIISGPGSPRFTTGYGALQNRLAITVESHMLKSYQTCVSAHYDLMVAALQKIGEDPNALRSAVQKADSDTIALGTNYDPAKQFAVAYHLNQSKSEPFPFHGIEYKHELSPVSGNVRIVYGTKHLEITVPVHRSIEPKAFVSPPLAYLIPPQWTEVIKRLQAHNIEFTKTSKPLNGDYQTYRFDSVKWSNGPFEARLQPTYKTISVTERRDFPAGSMLVRLNQRTNKVILGLLEPAAADSLVSWGFFNAIFENKEYAEAYVMEALAAEMLEKDPDLKTEFEKKLRSDSAFAGDPAARLQFFYERSPFWDQCKNAYPVVRITGESQLK